MPPFFLLPAAGHRDYSDGQLHTQTTHGNYWHSQTNNTTTHARRFLFAADTTDTSHAYFVGDAFSLRCIKI